MAESSQTPAGRFERSPDGASLSPRQHDPLSRSHSRGRAGLTRASMSPVPRTDRSSSRASFLGRPRHRTYQIYEDDENINATDRNAEPLSSVPTRWRSESRTVRGSLDDADDGFVFSDEETDIDWAAAKQSRGRRKSARSLQFNKHQLGTTNEDKESRSSQTTKTANTSQSGQQASEKEPQLPNQHASNGHHEKQVGKHDSSHQRHDVEAQKKEHKKPVSRLSRIPYPIAHFLGYRSKQTEGRALIRPVEKLPRKIETLIWAWIGAMLGLGFVMITFSRWDQFATSTNDPVTVWTAPIIIGSFGASSVILYGTPASPLGQPKAFVGGQFLSALISVCITKLFELNHNYNPNLIDTSHSLVWVAGGIATGTALCLMILTDTVHPPGGATALLGATSPPVIKLGWRYLPVVLLSSVIMEVWAMLWMNLGRARYPHYWYWPLGHPNDQRDFRLRFPGFKQSKNKDKKK